MLRSGATSYFHADGRGSITSLSSAAGSIANTYTYDSFGNLTASIGSLVNPFRYTARESDTETGLYYYRARYGIVRRVRARDFGQQDAVVIIYGFYKVESLPITEAPALPGRKH